MRHRQPTRCSFVPPHVLEHLARTEDLLRPEAERGGPSPIQRTAVLSKQLRDQRRRTRAALSVETLAESLTAPRPGKADRQIFDCQQTFTFDLALVRGEGDPPVGTPPSVNLGYESCGATRDFYDVVLGRTGIDNLGGPIKINVNYGVQFDNAFWDGERIVLGTGDEVIFTDFSKSPDVMGHELTHGVVQYTANLDYYSQSGALNESFADVMGSLVEQRLRKQDAGTANWLIGDEIMAPGLYGEALRSMAHPGTAYDNPVLGKDPQPAHMKDYFTGPEDNQGVHINSGIPNRAFYLTAVEIGTEAAGLIWFAGLQKLGPTAVFVDAAQMLAEQARILARDGRVPRQAAQTVRGAFRDVGVL